MGTQEIPKIVVPEEWSNAADTILRESEASPPPVVLICGAKNAGKTTFSRHLLNTFLSRFKKVTYLDTDVGQTEFTPPGFLSLVVVDRKTPDLTIPCLKTPERAYFFGDTSSKRNPTAYLKYIFTLYRYYKEEYCLVNKKDSSERTESPLVINTPGWIEGIGYSILLDMIKNLAPTHVVKMNAFSSSKNLPPGAFWTNDENDGTQTLVEISSGHQDSFSRPVQVRKDARLLRELRIMAYFRQCISSDLNIATTKELALALASHPPYEISISSIAIQHLHCEIPCSEIYYSLNATIVGLAISNEDCELPQCVGLGIVRGIDTSRQLLYVITPVPRGILENVDLFLQGFIEIPTCLLQVDGCMSPYISTNVLSVRSALESLNPTRSSDVGQLERLETSFE